MAPFRSKFGTFKIMNPDIMYLPPPKMWSGGGFVMLL